MYSDEVEKVVQLAYSCTFPGVMTGNSPAQIHTQTHTFSSWSQPITVEQPRCDAGSVPTTPGPWTSSTLPSEVVIFQ